MNHQKKTLCIAGSMLLPIKVGEPAMIREHDGGYRRTTTVLKMERTSQYRILAKIRAFSAQDCIASGQNCRL